MDIDREEFYEGLLRWLTSEIPNASASSSLDWMLTGKPMAEALVILVPEYFDQDWLEKTCSDVDEKSNWRVKANGLKKLLKTILQYYNQLTGQPVSEEHVPDVQLAAKDGNKAELAKMLQLILALAVNGSRRQDVIEHLMKAEESVQHIVMMSIQELEERKRSESMRSAEAHPSEEGLDAKLKHAQLELESFRENNEELARRCHELDQQIDALQDEKRILVADNERLTTKLASNESSDEADKSKRVQNLQQQNERLQEELFRMESGRDDAKAKFDALARQNKELQAKIDDLAGSDAEHIKMKDEIDELRGKVVEAEKLKSTVEMYKRKLEEMNELRLQVKIMQEKNDSYMKCAIEVDEERRRNSALKTHLESYKRQIQDLESKLADEIKRADTMEFEARRNKEKSDALQQERDRLVTERDDLRHLREELKLTQFQASSPAVQSELMAGADTSSSLPSNVTDLREQLLNLEYENRVLKAAQVESKEDQVHLLSSHLEDSNRRKQELETELRISNKKVIELEATLSDIRETQLEGGGGSGDARIVDLHRQSEYHSMEAQKAKQRLVDLEKQFTEKDLKLRNVETQLQVKEAEMKQQEAKYKSYLEKAKTVIAAFEQPVGGSNMGSGYSRAEFDALRRQLQEKEKIIQRMQEDQEKLRIMKEQEERLVTTSFHEMAMQLHKRSVDERLAGMNGQSPASFLARQRVALGFFLLFLLTLALTLAVYVNWENWGAFPAYVTKASLLNFGDLRYVNGMPPV